MRLPRAAILTASFAVVAFASVCLSDTFVHRRTRERLHGYATRQTEDGNTVMHTREKGRTGLNLTEWDITADRLGRNNKVVVLTLDGKIMLQMGTEALVEAIAEASDRGPLFILLEIDTPGGRTDYTRQICGAITRGSNCPVVAFVKGGKYGGAISAGAAVAFACDQVFMANNTVIGAAAAITLSGGDTKELQEMYGEELAEKISSAWRTYLASLAEQNDRPGLLACAMVDKDIEVIEVSQADRRLFIDPVNRTAEQELVHTWSKKGSLLTLTAQQAVNCKIADKIVNSRRELLRLLDAEKAGIVIDDSFEKAGRQFKRAKQRFINISNGLDMKIKQYRQAPTRIRAVKMLRDIKKDYRTLIGMAKRYPDLQVSVAFLERQLNSAEALYQDAKMNR
jgi:membrane-bound ClpP family serine protease